MKMQPILPLAVLLLPVAAFSQNTVSHNCTMGELTRRVEIFYEPGRTVPCEVHYYKDSEAPGERQVLWSATHQEGFCEQKTDEFVGQLESWGWDCGDVSAAAIAPDVADEAGDRAAGQASAEEGAEDAAASAADDTGDLAPAERESGDGTGVE